MRKVIIKDGLQFKRTNGAILKVSKEALEVMLSFRQNKKSDREAGGILLGRYIRNSFDIIIDEVSAPVSKDKRSRFGFRRTKKSHQKIIDDRWRESGGTCQYLGEWHSHPEPLPNPSTVDIKDWKRRLKKDVVDGDHSFFVIIGTNEIGIWEGFRKLTQINKLAK